MFAAIDQVPSELHDNAIILGCLSFFVAFLFLIDLADPLGSKRSGATQTDTNSIDRNDQSKRQIAVISNNANASTSGNGGIANATFTENLIQPDQTDIPTHDVPFAAMKPQNMNVRLPPKTQYLETDFNGQEATERFQRAPMQSRNYSQNYRQPQMETPENHYMEEAAEDEFEYHGAPQNYRNHSQNNQQNVNHNIREDYIQRQIFPTAQTPVFAKVKPAPTIINHFESEPYKKILSRPTQFQQRPNNQPQQYYPQRHVHPQQNQIDQRQQSYHDNANYVDDFAVYRHQTYVQASKVDQGKLVIRDYSKKAQPQKNCDCNYPSCAGPNKNHENKEATPIRPGYVANVAKIFDSRMMRVSKVEQPDLKGLSTVV